MSRGAMHKGANSGAVYRGNYKVLSARLESANLLLISSNHKKAIRLLDVHRVPSGLSILRRALHADDVAFNREGEKETQCHKG